MALEKRGPIYWIRFTHKGKRIQKSTGTGDKAAAQEMHDKLKLECWRVEKLDETPLYVWQDAVMRWLKESQHKRSLKTDKMHLRWLGKHLENRFLKDISRDLIEKIADDRQNDGVSNATINRTLELLRAILRKAHGEWQWLDRLPLIRMRTENNHRIRWITREEADRLIRELPANLADMAAFTLATGLRMSNVSGLQWCDINLSKHHAWIHPDESKTSKAIPVPLNRPAMEIIRRQIGKHDFHVFTYKNRPVRQCNTRAWRLALKRAGIDNFRWHDLRHTWASWHIQNGTSLQELQLLGGWSSFEMVLRYAHLSSDHLKDAADRINWYDFGTVRKAV